MPIVLHLLFFLQVNYIRTRTKCNFLDGNHKKRGRIL